MVWKFLRQKFRDVIVVRNSLNLGYSGINSAENSCKGDYILFLNNDMEIDRDCIGRMVKSIKSDKKTAMIAPKLVNFYDKKLESGGTWVSRAFYNGHKKGGKHDKKHEIPYMGVGLIRKDFVQKFGHLFDPDYFIYAEDLDLGLRIRLCGMRVIFDPNARIMHMHSVTAQKFIKSRATYLMERNLLTTFFKILSAKNIFLFLPYIIMARFLAIVKDTLSFNFSNAFSRLKAILFVIFNFTFIMKKRREFYKRVPETHVHAFIMCEVDILPDGRLALPAEAFDFVDAVIVSIHSSFTQPRSEVTKRVAAALTAHPKVRIFGHPTGRLLTKREGVDLNWKEVFAVCKERNIALEINAYPQRLDLPDTVVFDAVREGVKLVIDTDAHAAGQMDMMKYGVAVARRGWSTADDIVDTMEYNKFKEWLML